MPYTITKSDFAKALYDESKTSAGGTYWQEAFKQNQQLYEQAQQAAQEGIEQVKSNLYDTESSYIKQQQNLYRQGEVAKYDYSKDYNEALAKAYQSSLENRANLLGSNVISGYKEKNLTAMDEALSQAYESSTKQFNKSIAGVEQTVGEGLSDTISGINKARKAAQSDISDISTNLDKVKSYLDTQNEALYKELQSEAGNMEKTLNAVNDYYSYLYSQYFKDAASLVGEKQNPFLNNPNMRKFLDEGVDEAGQTYYRLKSVDELSSIMYDTDDKGNLVLNQTGRDFYDQIMNYNPSDLYYEENGVITDKRRTDFNLNDFDTWLKGKDKELYNWLMGADAYNYNATGQKFGTFKEMLGLDANDYEYSFLERAGGMNAKQLSDIFDKFDEYNENISKAVDDFVYYLDNTDPRRVMDKTQKRYDEFKNDISKQMTNTLTDYKKVLGTLGVTEYNSLIDDFVAAIKSGDEKDLKDVQKKYDNAVRELNIKTSAGFGVGAAGGAVIGTAILPGIGTAIGALLGGTASAIAAREGNNNSAEKDKYSKELSAGYKKYAKQLQSGYYELVKGLVDGVRAVGTEQGDKTAK